MYDFGKALYCTPSSILPWLIFISLGVWQVGRSYDPQLHHHVASLLSCRPYTPNPALLQSLPTAQQTHPSWRNPLLASLSPASLSTVCGFMNGTGYASAVFLHTTPNNAWQSVLDDTMRTLQHSVLSLCGTQMYYGFPATHPWPYSITDPSLKPAPPSKLVQASPPLPHIEQVTLSSLYEWCGAHPTALVSYVHDKGVRRGPEDVTLFLRQWDWRRLHEYFLLEVPQGCFKALTEGGFQVCGLEAATFPQKHYSGNFWWARCDFINTLPHPWTYQMGTVGGGKEQKDIDFATFVSPEVWIGSQAPRMFNCWGKHLDHFFYEYPRSLYVGAQCDDNMEVWNK